MNVTRTKMRYLLPFATPLGAVYSVVS